MKDIFATVLVVILLITFVVALQVAIDTSAKAECNKWVEESVTYPKFFLTENQKEQCDHYGIAVNAIVIP